MPRSRKERGHYGRPYVRMRAEKLAGTPACYLCGEPIMPGLHWKDPGAGQLHLIVPITKGGSWRDPNNAVPAHRLCNMRQSNHEDGTVYHGPAGVQLDERAWIAGEEP